MKLTQEGKELQARRVASSTEAYHAVQVAVYTMCGGGFLGASAANQPGAFYIGSRVWWRLPYPRRAILQAVEILALAKKMAGNVKGSGIEELPNLGVF